MRIKEDHKRSLTDARVRNLEKPPEGKREYPTYDTEVPGLYVTVFPSGTKSFYFAYSRGRPKTLLLGRAPLLTVDKARAMAMEHGSKLLLDLNYDPVAERKLLRGAI